MAADGLLPDMEWMRSCDQRGPLDGVYHQREGSFLHRHQDTRHVLGWDWFIGVASHIYKGPCSLLTLHASCSIGEIAAVVVVVVLEESYWPWSPPRPQLFI